MPNFKAVIFDLDGTLVSSSLDFQLMRQQVGCPVAIDILQYVAQLPQAEQANALEIIQQIELDDAKTATVLPGAKALVEHLNQLNIPIAIVTRNFVKAARIKLDNNQLDIPFLITRDDAPAKPDPAGLLIIAKEWNIAAEDIIYIGDYLYDVQAANNAKMVSCLYAPDGLPEYADQADITCQHLDEIMQLISG
ncbi:HAD family hydrolase [Pelagibaculum spongiae]|uniref:Phosphatase n=1 Tax=Pelagibaculum spongiae TaxID=2080658 RepID=A0A2V1H2V5_9GAMM|nr:HAD family hydrolase [Pelagibaculum spongiae]PVZ69627.1 phosphatase [Pelagibaculum spongiae]